MKSLHSKPLIFSAVLLLAFATQVGAQAPLEMIEQSNDFPTESITLSGEIASVIDQVDFQSEPNERGEFIRIDVLVTASSVGNIYLDKGRDAGIRPGDEVTLYPADDGIVNATVQSVSRNSSRCTILAGQRRIDVGTRGQVLSRAIVSHDSEPPSPEHPDAPEHPPWTHPPEEWGQDTPLLAPAFSQSIEDRPSQIRGRVFSNYLHTWNRQGGSNQYSLGRLGASLWMENPFRRGGGFRIDGEFNRRGVFLDEQIDDVDGPGRLDRFSYYWGGTTGRRLRFEAGRFLSYEFPEFGVIDGTEIVYRLGERHRIGASVGLLPEPFPNLSVSSDLHVAVFYRWVSDEQETISSGLGYQKTWHQGTPDRDLVVWSTDYAPNPSFSLGGSIWGDFYDSHDTLKSSSFEITQAIIQPFWRITPNRGVGAHVSYVRWPQLQRLEYSPFVQQQVVADHVFRTGINAWQDLGTLMRLNSRVDYWRDQDRLAGTNCEVRVARRDLFFDSSETALAVFYADGSYTSGPGSRLSFNRRLPWCYASFSYDIANYRVGSAGSGLGLGDQPDWLLQQSVQTNFDFTISSDKSVTLFTDYRFGRNQNAFQTGLFFQKRL